MSWTRAVLLGTGIALAAAILLLLVPHLIVTRPVHLSRGLRVTLAVAWFALSFPVVILALGRVQSRQLAE
jgi:tellurite resistance protein TehA-like permease